MTPPKQPIWERCWILPLCAAAALADWFAPAIFTGHTLVLGATFYWITLRRFRPQAAIAVLATSTLVLTAKWGQPYSALLIALEAWWVGWRWQKGQHPIVADLLFWGLVGTPASWFLYRQVYPIPHPSFEQALVVQVINGNLAVWAAIAAISLIPNSGARKKTPDSFRGFLLKRYLTVGTFPLLIAGMIAARQYEKNALAEARGNLTSSAKTIALGLGDNLDLGANIVSLTAARLSALATVHDRGLVERELARAHSAGGPFVTMLVADASGSVIAASILDPSGASRPVQNLLSVADREYFSGPMASGSLYISDAFQGRGLGRDILFAISAPITGPDGKAIGIVEGSWKVTGIESRFQSAELGRGWNLLLTDSHQRVIAGGDFGYQALFPLAKTPLGEFIARKTAAEPARFTAEADGEIHTFLSVSQPVPGTGWLITLQRSWRDILAPIMVGYVTLVIAALVAAVGAVALTTWSLREPLKAWGRLIAFSREPLAKSQMLHTDPAADLPQEFNELNDNLSQMAARLKSDQAARELLLAELETRVQVRTHELQSAMAAAQEANRAKSKFLATVSHELHTPLTSIITGTSLLRTGGSPRSEMENRTLRNMEKAGQVLLEVISGVLDYTRIGAGGVILSSKPFSPAEAIADVEMMLGPLARQSGLSLQTEALHPADFHWMGDRIRIEQVLINLVGNAVKFTEKGFVKISSAVLEATPTEPRRLCFTVQDSGPGIPAESLQAIFEPFVQLDSSRVKSHSGTGLGLSISRKLVGIMGGKITATSRPGEGSVFTFWVPESPGTPG